MSTRTLEHIIESVHAAEVATTDWDERALLATHDPTLMDIADSVLHLADGTIQS